MEMKIAGFLDNSMVNGEGLRAVVFVPGCNHNCKGCHNENMKDFNYGETVSISKVFEKIDKNSIVRGVTFSGGEPFEHADSLTELAKKIKRKGLNLWCYTGYTYEQILGCEDEKKQELLSYIDVLVDGPFIKELKEGALKYTGSSNQRILKLK